MIHSFSAEFHRLAGIRTAGGGWRRLLLWGVLVWILGSRPAAAGDLIITGVIDGPLAGGQPKAVALKALADISDLSAYGLGSANNGGGSDGEEFSLSGSANAGDFLYVADEATDFTAFFGFAPDVTAGAAAINGDDAIELFHNGAVVDRFGQIDVDGTGEPWEYQDGWAYRADGTPAPSPAFVPAEWGFSGPGALDGASNNSGAATPFPIGAFVNPANGAEPAAHPTGFSAAANTDRRITAAWTDSAGTPAPDRYLILANTSGTFTEPVDGTPIPEDPDCSDGACAVHAAPGASSSYPLDGLSPNTQYFFKIFPYTNGGPLIDYKTGGVVPTADATTLAVGAGWGINEIHADPDPSLGDANGDGTLDTSDDEFIEILNNTGGAVDISAWTISDGVGVRHAFPSGTTISDGCGVVVFGGGTPAGAFGGMTAQTASSGSLGLNNGGDDLILKNDSDVPVAAVTYGSEGGDDQSLTRDPDLTGGFGKHTTAAGAGGARFTPGARVDGGDFTGCGPPDPAPDNHPTDFTATPDSPTRITTTWTDAVGGQLPAGYLLLADVDSGFANAPAVGDGVPVPDDPDCSDGACAVNVAHGAGGTHAWTGLSPDTAHYFRIYPYTNGGPLIDYKTGGPVPTADATPLAAGAGWGINEIHADPDPSLGDANGDGTLDTSDDEFIEILNNTGGAVDISAWTISDGVGVRHAFPSGTTISDGCGVVVFGGGTPAGAFGGMTAQTASSGSLGLNNGGDDLILKTDSGVSVATASYGSEGGDDQSLTRDPDLTGGFEKHTTAAGAGGARFTPGTRVDGGDFTGCGPPPIAACDLSDGADACIHEIQGPGASSPRAGDTVTVAGIVVGDFQDGDGDNRDLGGFFVQEEDGEIDADPNTSEGIFVYDGTSPAVDVSVGDKVRVRGAVTEFFGLTEISGGPSVNVLSAGNPLPSPATVDLPAAAAISNADGEWIVDLEAFEGMLATFPDPLSVRELFQLDRFGEFRASVDGRPTQFTQENAPDPTGYEAHLQSVARRTVTVDDGRADQNPIPIIYPDGDLDPDDSFRMGDRVTNLEGVVHFSRGSGTSGRQTYRIMPTVLPTITNLNPRPDAPDDVGGTLRVASLNVLNFFNTLGERGANTTSELTRQTQKLVTVLSTLDADVVGLMELENNYAAGAGSAIATLTAALNAKMGAGTYAYVDPGGNVGDDEIAVGILHKPANVALAPGTTVEILEDAELSGLGLSGPIFTGPDTNRAPLAATFQENATGERFTFVVVHMKSKRGNGTGPNADAGDGAGPWNERRRKGAEALAEWLETDPTGSGDPDVLIVGDFNAYHREAPITFMAGRYTDLIADRIGTGAYSYVFNGQKGVLDYAFASAALADQATGVTEWHINADEPDALNYNEDFNPGHLFDGSTPYRQSDHDPVLIGLSLQTALPVTVTGNGASIARGDETPSAADHTDFGGADLFLGTVSRSFPLTNVAGVPLSVSATIDGAADFAVMTAPGPVAPGESTAVRVDFHPRALGERRATVILADAAGGGTFRFAVSGTGTLAVDVETDPVGAVSATSAAAGGSVQYGAPDVIRARGLVWSTSARPSVALHPHLSAGGGTGPFDGIVSGLTPGTTYQLRAYAQVRQGGITYTVYGPTRSFATPDSADTDGDGLPDGWEIDNGLDPDDPADAARDSDGDGRDNESEFLAGTDPNACDCLILGDANGDQKADLTDVILVLRLLAGEAAPPAPCDCRSDSGDANGDGRAGLADALYPLQAAAGLRP